MFVKSIADVPIEAVAVGTRTCRQVLIGPQEGPNFAMRRFVLQAGGYMPAHTNAVEHEQYVLRGRAQIGIGGQTYAVGPDHVVFIPAGVPHWYRVEGDEAFEFICVVPNKPDTLQVLK
jgi:quercetin dioxygenase-like cupin family protein